MDTKWRKFSRSRGFKGLLALIIIGAAAAIGAITGYIPASKYLVQGYAWDVLVYSDYGHSDTYGRKIIQSAYKVIDYMDAGKLNELSGCEYYICVEYNGSVLFSNDVEREYLYEIDSSGISSVHGDLPRYCHLFGYGQLDNGEVIYVGISEQDYRSEEANWNISRRNMLIILFTSIGLLAISIIAAIILGRLISETPEGETVWTRFWGLPFELSAGLLTALICLASMGLSQSYDSSLYTDFGFTFTFEKIWYMVWWGLAAAGIAAVALYFVLSISARLKNHRLPNGFLTYVIISLLWRGIRAVCRFCKELFTGELFTADRASRKLLIIDIVFLACSLILGILMLFLTNSVVGLWLCVILWLAILGLFIFGRYKLLSDEAKLEQQIRELSRGNYSYHPQLSRNSAYTISSDILSRISEKYRQGIEESVKAERMKIELVTNVSHDLKTPLTSIISYVDLLSKEQLPPQAAEYVEILQKKSERLKNIVSDVFELAKTTSGEIAVEHERIDLTRLSNQTLAEMEDKITSTGFVIKTDICEPPVEVISDGKRLYRVIQNLMDNALKYSLAGTRIYYTLQKTDSGQAVITIKNIAGYEMDFTKEEILERFARGDKSRTTEGSGLGLSISQGFTIACGGEFDIDIDGDMFKVKLVFPIAQPVEEPKTDDLKPQTVTADE